MTLTKLASLLAKAEGKKKEVSIGNVRELLARLMDQIAIEMHVERDGRQFIVTDYGDSVRALIAGSLKRQKSKRVGGGPE